MSDNLDLAIGVGDLDDVAKVAGAALNLDALVQELLEGEDIEDLVASGLLSVDDELLAVRSLVSHCFFDVIPLCLPSPAVLPVDTGEGEEDGEK